MRVLAAVAIMVAFAAGASAAFAQQHSRASAPARPSQPAAVSPTSASESVSFTVAPVILVVVDTDSRPLAVWTNLRSAPSAETRVVARRGSVHGPDVPVTAGDRSLLAQISWGRPGRVW